MTEDTLYARLHRPPDHRDPRRDPPAHHPLTRTTRHHRIPAPAGGLFAAPKKDPSSHAPGGGTPLNTPPPGTAISACDRRLLITAAVVLYDRHGDANDVLCSSQTDVIEKLRPLVHGPRGEECAAAISPRDVLSVATTAVELTDRHGSDDEDWRAAVERARVYVEVDDAES